MISRGEVQKILPKYVVQRYLFCMFLMDRKKPQGPNTRYLGSYGTETQVQYLEDGL